MGLIHEYQEDVENLEKSIESRYSYNDALDLKIFLDNILPFILILVTFVILFGFFLPVNATVQKWVGWANWTVIGYFSLRLFVGFRLARSKEKFIRQHWFDFLLIIPLFSLLAQAQVFGLLGEMNLPVEEGLVTPAIVQNTGVAAQMTRITRIVSRSV